MDTLHPPVDHMISLQQHCDDTE